MLRPENLQCLDAARVIYSAGFFITGELRHRGAGGRVWVGGCGCVGGHCGLVRV